MCIKGINEYLQDMKLKFKVQERLLSVAFVFYMELEAS